MAFDLKQSLKLSQQLLMTAAPASNQVTPAVEVRAEEFVTQQLAENPVLEEGVVESQEERIQVEREAERTETQAVNDHMSAAEGIVDNLGEGGNKSDNDWESYLNRQERSTSSSTAKRDDDFPSHENLARSGTLNDHLISQIGEIDLEDRERALASIIIGNIDEKGYLQSAIEDIANEAQTTVDEVEDILDVVQRLDPPGIASPGLKRMSFKSAAIG